MTTIERTQVLPDAPENDRPTVSPEPQIAQDIGERTLDLTTAEYGARNRNTVVTIAAPTATQAAEIQNRPIQAPTAPEAVQLGLQDINRNNAA